MTFDEFYAICKADETGDLHDPCEPLDNDPCVPLDNDPCVPLDNDPCVPLDNDPCVPLDNDPCGTKRFLCPFVRRRQLEEIEVEANAIKIEGVLKDEGRDAGSMQSKIKGVIWSADRIIIKYPVEVAGKLYRAGRDTYSGIDKVAGELYIKEAYRRSLILLEGALDGSGNLTGFVKNNFFWPWDLSIDVFIEAPDIVNDPLPSPEETSGWVLPFSGNFPGPGWSGPAKTRPRDIWDLAAKIHDFNYVVNKLKFFGNAMGLTSDWKTRSRKAKSDYIFRMMTSQNHVNPAEEFWGFGANAAFSGTGEGDFRKNDCFQNVLNNTILDEPEPKYFMIPYSSLTEPKSERHYKEVHAMDRNPGWAQWKISNVPYWSILSSITSQTGR